MPTARTDQQHRNIFLQLVTLSFRAGKTDRPPDRIPQIDLALNHIRPRRRIRVFEIGHENLCAGIERINHHLAIARSGNLDPPIAQIRWNRCAGPVALTDRFCFRQKIECFATIESDLSILPALQTFFPAIAESALQLRNEGERFRANDFKKRRRKFAAQPDAWRSWDRGTAHRLVILADSSRHARLVRNTARPGARPLTPSPASVRQSVKKAIPLLAHHAEILVEIVLDDSSGLHAASL